MVHHCKCVIDRLTDKIHPGCLMGVSYIRMILLIIVVMGPPLYDDHGHGECPRDEIASYFIESSSFD